MATPVFLYFCSLLVPPVRLYPISFPIMKVKISKLVPTPVNPVKDGFILKADGRIGFSLLSVPFLELIFNRISERGSPLI